MIDILMASYNGEAYIKEQLESIFSQSYKNWRLIIHDDCSTDATMSIIAQMAETTENEVVHQVNKTPCKGAAPNFLGLVKESVSDYAMFCDQDDVWHTDKIETSLRLLKKMEKKYGTEQPLLVYTDLAVVDEYLQEIAPSFIDYMNIPRHVVLNRLLIQNNVTGCTVIMNRTLCKMLAQIDDFESVIMHDHLAALIAASCGHVGVVSKATMKYRQHGDNCVGASNAKSFAYMWGRYRRGKKEFQKDLKKSFKQAGYVYDMFGEMMKDDYCRKIVGGYADLNEKNKWYRVLFYVKNRVLKYGWIRMAMQLIWG